MQESRKEIVDPHGEAIEVFAPSPHGLFQPFSPDGNLVLLPIVSDYILRRARALPGRSPIQVKVRAKETSAQSPELIACAIGAHFLRQSEIEKEALRRTLRHGLIFLMIGLALVLLMSSMAAFLKPLAKGNFAHGFVESLVIFGWVALWRPADVLLYEWIPLYRNVRLLRRLSGCETQVEAEKS